MLGYRSEENHRAFFNKLVNHVIYLQMYLEATNAMVNESINFLIGTILSKCLMWISRDFILTT